MLKIEIKKGIGSKKDQKTFSATMLSSLLAVAKVGFFRVRLSISSESYSRNITERYLHEITDFKI